MSGTGSRILPPVPVARAERNAWVVGSGKGGVGKSVLAALMASELARRGRATLLLDGAQRDGSLHVLLGCAAPARLEAVWRGEADPEELLVPLDEGLWLLPAPSAESLPRALSPIERARLHRRCTDLYARFDAVVVDAGPGLEGALRAVTQRAAALAVVATPEPAALAEAYALVKLAHLEVPHLALGLVANRVDGDEEAAAVHARLDLAAQRFLNRSLPFWGAFPEHPALRAAARTPGRLLESLPAALRAAAAHVIDACDASATASLETAA